MVLNPADGYPHTPDSYAEFAGDLERQSFQFVKDLDAAMRANYAVNIVNIGQNIYPLLYVESTFDGGRYTLLTDKTTRFVHQDVRRIYDVTKAIAHIPLGIFSIISGYGEHPKLGQWIPDLEDYKKHILNVQRTVYNVVGVGTQDLFYLNHILSKSLSYIQNIIDGQSFNYTEFSVYARELGEAILYCQNIAASDQVYVMKNVLQDWKGRMRESEWDKLYVIIGAVWTLTQENAHELIIKSLMKPEFRETHVVVSEAVPDLETAQALMGRIVGDRVMAELIFDAMANPAFAQDIYSLSTRRDLLSQAVEAVVGDVSRGNAPTGAAVGCPHLRN